MEDIKLKNTNFSKINSTITIHYFNKWNYKMTKYISYHKRMILKEQKFVIMTKITLKEIIFFPCSYSLFTWESEFIQIELFKKANSEVEEKT